MRKQYDVVIIDFKMGNLFSVQHACNNIGLVPIITSDRRIINKARSVILPGVGSFAEAMKNLKDLGLISELKSFISSGRPFMGICLGFQLLFSESEEFGRTEGLNIFKGFVKKIPNKNPNNEKIKIPKIGWNQIYPLENSNYWKNSLLKNVRVGEFMYFVHSFYVDPENEEIKLTKTNYEGFEYCSSIENDNVFASQFHPEKSAKEGMKIYKNFADRIRNG